MMATRIRILHVIPSLDVGGMENGVVNLINALPADRFGHHVACLLRSGPLAERIRGRAGVTELLAGRHDPKATLRLARTILRYRPHLVHARNWNCWPDAAAACAMTGVGRLIWSIHGWTTDQRMTRTRASACRQLARWTRQLCAVCRDAAERLADEAGLPVNRFEVLYNGVDAERFAPRADRAAARAALGLPPDACVVGAVGRLDPIKNYDLLIEAVARLRCERTVGGLCEPDSFPRGTGEVGDGEVGGSEVGVADPSYRGTLRSDGTGRMAAVQLVFCGDGPEEGRLRDLAGRLGVTDGVRFLGRRGDVPAVLAAFDVFALTSRREGMSNAILEAMASGLPVVATRVGGNAEMVIDGETGLLIESGAVGQLVAAFRKLVGQPDIRRAMGAAGRRRVESVFSMGRMVEAYARMYQRVASDTR
jgi:glycosyltransferase involved in cell wall biosynthesis